MGILVPALGVDAASLGEACAKGVIVEQPVDLFGESREAEDEGPAEGSLAWVKQELAKYDDFQAECSELLKLFRRRRRAGA